MMWFHLHAMLSKLTIVFQCLHVTETFNATADDWKKMHVAPCGVYMSWPYLSLYIFISIYIYTTFLPMELKVADSTRGLAACVARPLHWVSVDARIPAALFFASADRSACFLALTLSWPASAAWLIFLVFAVQIAKFMKWWIKIMQTRRMQRVYSCLTDQVFFPDQHCSNISYIY